MCVLKCPRKSVREFWDLIVNTCHVNVLIIGAASTANLALVWQLFDRNLGTDQPKL